MPSPDFLNVPALLERSQPRARGGLMWFGLLAFVMVVLASAAVGGRSPAAAALVRVFSMLTMLGLITGMAVMMALVVRRARGEQQQLEAVEELMQLRRWPQAAAVLDFMLSRPTRSPAARVQGLIHLSRVLARYDRYDDAIAVQNHLLDHVALDAGTAHALRLGRAMAMLREDHLFDADRAIADLRRTVRGAAASAEADESPDQATRETDSAGLALIEIYRDVKTGHPAEAVELFERKLPVLRQQLGHRVGDAWALAARAYDLLGRPDDARRAYENATLLTDPAELGRRYPETAPLSKKYSRAQAPPAA